MRTRERWNTTFLLAAAAAASLGGCGAEGEDSRNAGSSTSTADLGVDGGPGTNGNAASGTTTGGSTIGGTTTGESTIGGTTIGGTTIGGTTTGGTTTGGTTTGGAPIGGTTGATGGTSTTSESVTATGGATSGGSTTGGPSGSPCLDGITDYQSDGPFDYTSESSGSVKLWIPQVPAGCKVPMVHYSNGTSATCSFYQQSLVRLASHGFLTLCYEDTNTGAGMYGMEAFETALAEYPDLAELKFGSTGHSQGGMASLVTLHYAEEKWGQSGLYAGLAVEPASGYGDNPAEAWETIYGRITSPVFMFSGLGTDGLVSQSWVQQAFDALSASVEAYFWTKDGASHISTVNQDQNEVLVSWFRWKLLGDQNACEYFKAIPSVDSTWAGAASQNEVDCQ